ncbi:hypothetical protein O0L34_g14992 [Tuta absoluta]|nr:hypothetical protein O0L34_g14992 [Tuta absoluta]
MNGGMEHKASGHNAVPHKAPKNYKMLMDPFLVKGATKLYRYDGQVPGDSTYPPVQCRDPRSQLSRIWNRLEPADLPVPRFKIDQNYVGTPPQIEITIANLNDNIDKAFLADMMNKVGPFEELTIFYHPITNRHLGFARVVFQEVKYSKLCVEKYNGKSVMGKVLDVIHDPFGKRCQEMLDEKTLEKKPAPPPVIKPPVVEDVRVQKVDPTLSKRLEDTKLTEKEPYPRSYKDHEHSDSNTRWSDDEREYRHRHRSSRSERDREKPSTGERDRDRDRYRERYARGTSESSETPYAASSHSTEIPYTPQAVPYDAYYQTPGYGYPGYPASAPASGSGMWWPHPPPGPHAAPAAHPPDWRQPHHAPHHHSHLERRSSSSVNATPAPAPAWTAPSPATPASAFTPAPAAAAPAPKERVSVVSPVATEPKEKKEKEKEVPPETKPVETVEPRPPVDAADSKEPEPKPPPPSDEPKNVDLDTRIAMLLKGASGGGGLAPPFLSLNMSSEEEEDGHLPTKIPDLAACPPSDDEGSGSEDRDSIISVSTRLDLDPEPLSTTPSPYLSREMYLQVIKATVEKKAREAERRKFPMVERIGSDISSSEDELLTGEEPKRSPMHPPSQQDKDNLDDDQVITFEFSELFSGDT